MSSASDLRSSLTLETMIEGLVASSRIIKIENVEHYHIMLFYKCKLMIGLTLQNDLQPI